MKKIFFLAILLISAVTLLFSLHHLASASGNLLTYWKLDETTAGSTASDSSGNGYNGTPHGSPSPSTDVPSTISFSDPRSLSFNGSQWVSIPDNSAFAMTSATFSVWVKFTSLSDDMNMIAKRSGDGSQIQWQFGYSGGGNNFKVSLANDGGHGCCTDFNWSPSPGLTTNTWYNIAVVINGTGHTITWYQNGVSKHSESIGSNSLGTQLSSTDLTLGASYNGTGELLHGLLDDVRIYNTALSGTEVSDIAAGNAGPGVPTPTPTSTPTPSPSPTPTATPTPTSNNTSGGPSSSTSSNNQTSCTNAAPGFPNLFQVTTSLDNATVYFSPVSTATSYVLSYGAESNADQYTASFNATQTTGVVSYTVNSLQQNTKYYFKVEAKNDCMPGSWSQILSQMTTANEVSTANQDTQSGTSSQTSAPQKTISVIKQDQTATPSSNSGQKGYDLAVTVNNNGQPVSGAIVELHSTPMRTTTDKNGIARFTNVEVGNHTVSLAYQGYQGQEHIAVSGDKKDIAVNMTIKLNNSGLSPLAYVCIAILIVVIVTLILYIFLIAKRRKQKKDTE